MTPSDARLFLALLAAYALLNVFWCIVCHRMAKQRGDQSHIDPEDRIDWSTGIGVAAVVTLEIIGVCGLGYVLWRIAQVALR